MIQEKEDGSYNSEELVGLVKELIKTVNQQNESIKGGSNRIKGA